jgi:hypothetical protein
VSIGNAGGFGRFVGELLQQVLNGKTLCRSFRLERGWLLIRNLGAHGNSEPSSSLTRKIIASRVPPPGSPVRDGDKSSRWMAFRNACIE